jgi:hypothetical protein
MGVRPPADNSDEPDVIEFGIAALDARLTDVEIEYPATAAEVRDAAGPIAVPFDASGHSMTVAEALEETNATRFDNEQELLNDLHPIFEQKREATRNSILSQLRALVPF